MTDEHGRKPSFDGVVIVGIEECACCDFEGHPTPEGLRPAVWLTRAEWRKALHLLARCEDDVIRSMTPVELGGDPQRPRYHGGVHVDGIHVLRIKFVDRPLK